MTRFVPNPGAFIALNAPNGVVGRGVARAAGRTRDRARRKAPVDKGTLRQSIRSDQHSQTATSVVYRISANTFYAKWQHEGVRGPIFPRRAKVLRFKPKGASGFVFAKFTRGFKGTPYLTDALRELTTKDFL